MYAMLKCLFTAADDTPYAGYDVVIKEKNGGPARIYTADGLLVASDGRATTDDTGLLSVYVSDGKEYSLTLRHPSSGAVIDTVQNLEPRLTTHIDPDTGGASGGGGGVDSAELDAAIAAAEGAAALAQAARDASFVTANVGTDLATQRATVADGQQFTVVTGDYAVRYRRDTSTTQTELARYPTKSLTDRLLGLPQNEFPGTRNLYGPILTPRTTNLAGSNFAVAVPPNFEFTVSPGTANDYTAAIDSLVPGQPFIIYVFATSGTIGVTTFTMNGVKALTEVRGCLVWEGVVPVGTPTASIIIKNGSAVASLVGCVRFAVGPIGATGLTPQESTLAIDSFFDSGEPTSDQEVLRAVPSIMLANASSATVDVTAAAALTLGDTVAMLARSETLGFNDATINDIQLLVTAGNVVTYSLYPLAEYPGWWYREIYIDPASFSGGSITQVRTNANNLNNSNHYEETPRRVTPYIFRAGLPRFYPSAAPDEGKGIQNRGNMRSRTYSTTSAAQFNGYHPALFGSVRRLWVRSSAGGDYLVARKDVDTGVFLGPVLAITHPGGGAGNEWADFTNQIPKEWRLPKDSFVIGLAPNPANGTPGLIEYANSAVGDTAFTNSSWFSGTTDGDAVTFFSAGQDRIIGIYCEAEDRPGSVKRMGPMPLTRTGPADYQIDFILGQSGYEGYALNSSNLHDYSKITPAASLMWSKSQQALVPVHDPVGQNFVGGGSLWPAYAAEFEKRMVSRAVILVNSAVGGTRIENDWWSSSTGAKTRWTDAIADFNGALNAAHAANLPISGVVVHIDLGEGNGLVGTTAAVFKAHLVSWLVQIRNLISPYTPVFYRPLGRGAPADTANFAEINKAINELVNEDPYFFMASSGEAITDDRGLKHTDNYHDKLEAQEETGRLLAALTPVPASKAMPKNYTLDIARP
jgi:hypothetical protein